MFPANHVILHVLVALISTKLDVLPAMLSILEHYQVIQEHALAM